METIGNRDKVLAFISLVLLCAGLYGLHNDWTLYVIIIPFGWLVLGALLDFAINNKGNKRSGLIAILCSLLIVNTSLILVHNDTPFVLGRLFCEIGVVVMIVRVSFEDITG